MPEVVEVNSLHLLLERVEASLGESRGPRWFRGCGSYPAFKLEPSLLRHPDVKDNGADPLMLEQRMRARFLQTSAPFLAATPPTDLDWLFLQQHYGVPTRLLDWSENPFIALYFALSSSPKDDDACVWMLNPIKWNQSALNNAQLDRIPDPTLPQVTQFLKDPGDDFSPSEPIAIFGNHTNPRITAQRGTFVMFCKSRDPMETKGYAEGSLVCLQIPVGIKKELYEKLLSIGYTHSVVYPDLSGLGVEIKTSFGF